MNNQKSRRPKHLNSDAVLNEDISRTELRLSRPGCSSYRLDRRHKPLFPVGIYAKHEKRFTRLIASCNTNIGMMMFSILINSRY